MVAIIKRDKEKIEGILDWIIPKGVKNA